jgi:hypothetical protein
MACVACCCVRWDWSRLTGDQVVAGLHARNEQHCMHAKWRVAARTLTSHRATPPSSCALGQALARVRSGQRTLPTTSSSTRKTCQKVACQRRGDVILRVHQALHEHLAITHAHYTMQHITCSPYSLKCQPSHAFSCPTTRAYTRAHVHAYRADVSSPHLRSVSCLRCSRRRSVRARISACSYIST